MVRIEAKDIEVGDVIKYRGLKRKVTSIELKTDKAITIRSSWDAVQFDFAPFVGRYDRFRNRSTVVLFSREDED